MPSRPTPPGRQLRGIGEHLHNVLREIRPDAPVLHFGYDREWIDNEDLCLPDQSGPEPDVTDDPTIGAGGHVTARRGVRNDRNVPAVGQLAAGTAPTMGDCR